MPDQKELIEQALAETDALIEQTSAHMIALDTHHKTLAALQDQIAPPEPEPGPEPDDSILLGQPGDSVLVLPKPPTPISMVDGNGHCELVQVSWPLDYWKWWQQDDGSVYGEEHHASGQKVTLVRLTLIRYGSNAPALPIADLPFESGTPDPGPGPTPPDTDFEPLPPIAFPPAPGGDISIEIICDTGDMLELNEADGEALGTFNPDPPFTRRASCVRARVAGWLPYVMIVRDLEDAELWQVWFLNFRLWPGAEAAADLPAYTATIFKAGEVVARYDVPIHYWAGAWRHLSKPYPVIRQPADCLPFVLELDAGAARDAQETTTAPTYAVMQVNSMTPSMPDTGDRGEIGLYTEYQGEWLVTGNGQAYEGMLVQDEELACFPMNWIDEGTGAPVSLSHYPTIDAKPGSGSPYQIPVLDCPLIPDSAHMPATGYVPYLANEDPWHLWLSQNQITWEFFSYHQGYRQQGEGRIGHEQTRSYAWILRALARAARLSPGAPPAWLLARDYFEQRLENNRGYFMADFVEKPEPLYAVLRQAVQTPADYEGWNSQQSAPWQEEFCVTVFGEIVKTGGEAWRPILEWKADSSIARFSQRDGWPRAFGCPYRIILADPYGAPFAASWAEAMQLNIDAGNLDAGHMGDEWVDLWNYWSYARAAHCAMTQTGPAPAADVNLEWFARELARPDCLNPWRWSMRAAPAAPARGRKRK
jgi:hypothetical protein